MYAILPVTLIDGRLAIDPSLTGVHAGYSAESQAEARAHCLTLHPIGAGTVREHIGADDGPDTAVRGPAGDIVGYLGCAPSTDETLSLPPGHPGHAYCD